LQQQLRLVGKNGKRAVTRSVLQLQETVVLVEARVLEEVGVLWEA
jgi:hypothetical protein